MKHFICRTCKKTYASDTLQWCCSCGGLFDLLFEGEIVVHALANRPPNLWRYREAIPIKDDAHLITLNEGFTPLTPVNIEGKTLRVKQDHLFPSGSYKDRGATVLISHAKSFGIQRLVEDSSGNAGAAVASYAARAGIACDIYVPNSTSPAKLAQIQSYGATLHKIPGSREDTAHAVQDAAQKYFYASHVWNPFFFHGTKTFAYEIWEQLDFKTPDTLIIPTGNGTLLLGVHIGFTDLLNQNLIKYMPKLIAVQSTHCAPLTSDWTGESSATIAEGIAIAEPARAEQMRECIEDTNGEILTVTDDETLAAHKQMAEMGFYIEPTSATAIAAFKKYPARNDEVIVAPLTGHGLKTTGK
jgi:threonine synthase